MAGTSLSSLQCYSSSESEGESENYDQHQPDLLTLKQRLPLPKLPSFGVPKSISRETSNIGNVDATGKIRNFAHESGNWATYVALVTKNEELDHYVKSLTRTVFSSMKLELVNNWHISLTRVIVLRHHWINDFVNSVRNIFTNTKRFQIIMRGLSVYTNDQKTRTFLGLDMYLGQSEADDLVNQLDSLLSEYSLPNYYQNRSYHISLLWGSGDCSKELQSILDKIPSHSLFDNSYCLQDYHGFCKIGNKSFNFNLM